MMKRPLLVIALLHVAGILVADRLPVAAGPLLAATLLLSLFTWAVPSVRPLCLPPLLFLTGIVNFTVRTSALSPHDLRSRTPERFTEITLRGTLSGPPQVRESTGMDPARIRSTAEFNVRSLKRTDGNWEPATGKVLALVPGVLPSAGRETLEAIGVLGTPDQAAAPGLFDYRAYLNRKGIHRVLRTESTNSWSHVRRASGVDLTWPARFQLWARTALARGLPDQDPDLRLIWAMTLGWKTGLTGDVAEPFMKSGTMHLFAISGLHIGLIATIILSLLRVMLIPRPACGIILIPLLWFYAAATGGQPSAVRATVMATVIVAGWALRRPGDLLNSLSAAALLLLLVDPQQIFLAGFQLSFAVVLSIALLTPLWQKHPNRWLRPDPLRLRAPQAFWRRQVNLIARYTLMTAVTSLAAWIGSVPLIAHYFNFLTPVAVLSNVLVLPLGTLALMSSLGSLITAPWLEPASVLFNHGAWFWMRLMTAISSNAAGIPGAWFHVPHPPLLLCVVYYASLLILACGWSSLRRRPWRGIVLTAAFTSLIPILYTQLRTTTLSILPLGGGELLYLDGPGSAPDSLIDCGNNPAVRNVTIPFLRSRGVNRIRRLILTHGDVHNVGGALALAEAIPIKEFVFSPLRFRSPAYRRTREQAEQSLPHIVVARGDRIGPWEVLHPDRTDAFPLADDGTLVLRAVIEGRRVLFLSDLGRRGQGILLNRFRDLEADLLIAGLPRSSAPLSPRLLQAVRPEVIVVTDSAFPANERAGSDLQRALARLRCRVIYTRDAGGVSVRFTPHSWEFTTAHGGS